jgi:hypothetical protein
MSGILSRTCPRFSTVALFLVPDWGMNRETSREGWPLLTVETEVNGDSKKTNLRGHSFMESFRYNAGDEPGSDCRTSPPSYIGWQASTTTRRHSRLHPPNQGLRIGPLASWLALHAHHIVWWVGVEPTRFLSQVICSPVSAMIKLHLTVTAQSRLLPKAD